MDTITFTPEVISAIMGAFLALLFAYFPVVRTWFAGLLSEVKSLIMIGLMLATTAIVAVLAHYGFVVVSEPITWFSVLKILFAALIANQPTYTILPQTRDVKAAIASRNQRLLYRK